MLKNVLVTGGAGYVGSVLLPKLLEKGHTVTCYDLMLYGDHGVPKTHPNLKVVKADIRDLKAFSQALKGVDAVIHLACISNDPSFELNPTSSRKVNYEAFEPLVRISKESGVRRFIYASTCSVYGLSDAENVTEDHPLVPITDYNKYKGLCEPILFKYQSPEFTAVTIRPATVCGYSPRQRFDLTVNILTNHAYNNNHILVFGGSQERPNLHIEDMTDLYGLLLELPDEKIAGKTYNAGYQNRSVADIAEIVRRVMAEELPERPKITVETRPSDDIRSYRISSEKIKRELNFVPRHTIEDAVRDLIKAFKAGKFQDSLNNIRYFNIKTLKSTEPQCAV